MFDTLRSALEQARAAVSSLQQTRQPDAAAYAAKIDAIVEPAMKNALRRGDRIDTQAVKNGARRTVDAEILAQLRPALRTTQMQLQALVKAQTEAQRVALAVRLPEIPAPSLSGAEELGLYLSDKLMFLAVRELTREQQLSQRETVRTRLAFETRDLSAAELLEQLEAAEGAGDLVAAAYLDPRVERALERAKPEASGTTPEERIANLERSTRELEALRGRYTTLRDRRQTDQERAELAALTTEVEQLAATYRREVEFIEITERRGSILPAKPEGEPEPEPAA
jgi:hypothetical protein